VEHLSLRTFLILTAVCRASRRLYEAAALDGAGIGAGQARHAALLRPVNRVLLLGLVPVDTFHAFPRRTRCSAPPRPTQEAHDLRSHIRELAFVS